MQGSREKGGDDGLVVGYFSSGADAYRAIRELMDEGFSATYIGAAFRTSGARNPETLETAGRPAGERNPALTGSVGGAGSHDEAVTPAGLAPGSGSAFPAPGAIPPIPGAEVPRTLPHDLPSTLPSTIPSTLRGERTGDGPGSVVGAADPTWMDRLRRTYEGKGGGQEAATRGGTSKRAGRLPGAAREAGASLIPAHPYSESAFESSFVGLGLGSMEARRVSSLLNHGGAVVTVIAGARSSLAEAILSRSHGQTRFGEASTVVLQADREAPVEVYGSLCGYYRPEEDPQRKAS